MLEKCFAIFERIWYPFEWLGVSVQKSCHPFERLGLSVQKKMLSVWTAWRAIRSKKNVIRLNGLGCLFGKNCPLLERLGISVSKDCYPFGWLGLSIRKSCRPLEELNLSVQRWILAEFPSQNHFISSHLCQTTCYSPGLLCYEVCLQTCHEQLWISSPL